jgi:hypothetical protein
MLRFAQIVRQDRIAAECATLDFVPPEQHYLQRLQEREARLVQLDISHARIGGVRLAIGASFLIVAWLCFGKYAWPPAWFLLPLAAFIAAVLYHTRIRSARQCAQRAAQFYRDGLARMRDEWQGKGCSGARFAAPHHLYSGDLDVFGTDSLFALLCAARTDLGEATLAHWLTSPANAMSIGERQAAIRDLRGRLDLREALAIAGDAPRIELPADTLIEWSTAPGLLNQAWIRVTVPLLTFLAVGTGLVWAIWGLFYPLSVVLLIELAVTYLLRNRVAATLATVENAHEGLKGLSSLLERVEAEQFEASPLRALVAALSSQAGRTAHGLSASRTLAKLATIANFVEARRNPLLTPLLLLLMYPQLTALAAERWRRAHGPMIGAWLKVLGEFEALLSLAQFSDEHPEYPFPEFAAGPAVFEGEQLGHPLLPRAARICNDVNLSSASRVWIVSGSNMSGKSTLLRTVGVNTILAMAGAPVCARRMRLTPLQVGASIRVNDSLHEGSSRFYAEITRLRQLFDPHELPLLFLLDELLQGTNSADRRVGAQGVIRALLKRGAIGLISTHDLALTDVVDAGERGAVNVHFQDEIRDGKLYFDFKLHAGVVTKSNGIELMRSIGLEV